MKRLYILRSSEAFCAFEPKGPGYHFVGRKNVYWVYYGTVLLGEMHRVRWPRGWRGQYCDRNSKTGCDCGPHLPTMLEAAQWMRKNSSHPERTETGELVTEAMRKRIENQEELYQYAGINI